MNFITRNIGCKVNAYELAALTRLLLKDGHRLGNDKHFDFAIINTCTVTHVASQKSRQHIRQLKQLNPKAIIVVMGCYATLNAQLIVDECGADIVVGVNERKLIPSLINQYQGKPIVRVSSIKKLRTCARYEELGIHPFTERTRAYVKISDGCNNFCSYCVIPFVRGRLRSRNKKEIFSEIKELLKDGYKEIVLTGVDTASYGNVDYRFSDLLSDILKKFPQLYRLRISSIEISEIDQKFLKLLKLYPNIANHLHIPLQSGSDKVLKKMNRKYDCKTYLDKINAIRKVRPDIAITTDLIVGFPNEDEKAFKETLNFIEKVNFAQMHIFPYSKRENTAASRLLDLNSAIKKERVNKVLKIAEVMEDDYQSQFFSQKLEVLFEGNHTGLTSNYLRITANYPANSVHQVLIKKTNIK